MARIRKARHRSRAAIDQAVGTCPDCGKRSYTSRREARTMARRLVIYGGLHPYPCGDYWHLGHHRESVRRGLEGREVYNQ